MRFRQNELKTTLLLTGLTVLLLVMGRYLGGRTGLTAAFFVALVMNLGTYWFSDRIILRMVRAERIPEGEMPEVEAILGELAEEMEIPVPRVYFISSPAPNAFATGRDPYHAAVVLTQGLLAALGREELKGVLAHELAHVKHQDILISSVAAILAGAVSFLARGARRVMYFGGGRGGLRAGNPIVLILMIVLFPIAAVLIRLCVSRTREYAADEEGGATCGNPLFLASALRKIEAGSQAFPMQGGEETTAHLFILNPLGAGGWARLFSTHPPIEERIARLEEMAREQGL